MHEVSDGERRRVQIVSGLMEPWEMLLLDEVSRALHLELLLRAHSLEFIQVTVDLDVLVRSKLLAFLVEETETRGSTILYATHIFDGLDSFPTHLCHLQLGSTIPPSPLPWPLPRDEDLPAEGRVPASVRDKMERQDRSGSRMLELALWWLEQDKHARMKKEVDEHGERKRGAKDATVVGDSEKFYRQ